MISVHELRALTREISVLYVEDDKDISRLMEVYLKKFFKEVETQEDGEKAFESYQKKKFDLVITDLLMPKMDGFALIRAIKEISPEQVILVTTAYSQAEHKEEVLALGAEGYISKPFDFLALNQELRRVCLKVLQRDE